MHWNHLLRRRSLLILAGLVVVGVILWVGYFLATFDLNHYRVNLATELGNRLQTPVQLGAAHVELREAGIALRFSELQIGTDQTRFELRADTLWLQLAWRGLLLRKPIFSEVALAGPHLRISPPPTPPPPETPAEEPFDLAALRDFKVRRIEIEDGAIDLAWRGHAGSVQSLRLHDLSVNLYDLGLERTVSLDLSGKLSDHPSPASLVITGSVDIPATGPWQAAVWDCALQAKGVDTTRLAELLPEHMPLTATGVADLALFVKRQADATVTVQADVTGRQLRVRPAPGYPQAIPLGHLQVAGIWQRGEDRHLFRQLAIRLDDLRLAGELSVAETPSGTALNGKLSNCTLPVDNLRRWIPHGAHTDHPLFAKLQPGGLLSLETATFRGDLPSAPQQAPRFSLDSLTGEATGLTWLIAAEQRAELTSLGLHLAEGQWQFTRGVGTLAGLPVAGSGSIATQGAAPPRFAFAIDSHARAEQLAALWPDKFPADLSLTGSLRVRAHLAGTPEQLTLAAHADLAQLEGRYGDYLQLPAVATAALTVQGQGTSNTLTIEQASLDYPPLHGTLAGVIDWSAGTRAELTGRVEIAELGDLQPLVPVLAKLQLHGKATLELALNGPLADAPRPQVRLALHDVSIPTRGLVADIAALSGRLHLDGQALRSDTLKARIGKSPVTLRARVADLQTPRLELDIEAAAVRADELIFPSDRAVLRDLRGRLVIDRDGLLFDQLKVRLDGGTRAMVNGSVRNFDAPQVDLDITGDYANVEEIIGLWTDLTPEAKAHRKSRETTSSQQRPLPPVRIVATADQGDLYGMHFTEAKALIVPTSSQLLIHPLDFKIGAGYCTSQVRVDFKPTASVLRLSGHVEEVDAYAVHNQLLHRKSIVRGRLRGDFYLQGELGGRGFLPTAFGNISATVRDGVMRHSPVVGSIFSVLNVSQLFQFKLPDINLEGLPFSLLTTELAIDQGVISTEQLVIDSDAMNMSYAGQYDMVNNQLDLLVVAKPLGTIDKVLTRLPIAGWILGGEERALITAQFRVTGPGDKPDIEAIPISAISKGLLGIFQRTLGLPFKLIEDPSILWGGGGERKD
jgi:hypothetical protein